MAVTQVGTSRTAAASRATERASIETLCALQRERGLTDVHLVDFDDRGFTIAHTDAERAAGGDLEACELHQWALALDGPPVDAGVVCVAVPHEPDARSEDYGADPWDLHPLEPACPRGTRS